MDNSMSETQVLRLESPVVVRKVPMTAQGSDMLRTIRAYQQELYAKAKNKDVVIPYPVCIHMMMADYCKLKGLKIPA